VPGYADRVASRESTVWMVSARTGLDGRKGRLLLNEKALVFQPESDRYGANVFPLGDVRRIRRAKASPVLEIHLELPDAPRIVAFYFVKPPPMRLPDDKFRLFPRYFARRSAIAELRKGNAMKRQEVIDWIEDVERAQGN
jgi:hypothetical protein